MFVEEIGEEEGGGGGGSSDGDGLDGATEPSGTDKFAFDGSEESEGDEGDNDGELEGLDAIVNKDIGEEGDKAARDVGDSDGEGRAAGAIGGWLFEAEFESHHEVDPGGGVLLECGEDGRSAGAIDGVLLENHVDFFFFVVGSLDDLTLFSLALGDVVLDVSTSGEVSAKTHGDGAGGDFSQAREDHDVRGGNSTRETGGESEGDGKAVREADYDVADGFS